MIWHHLAIGSDYFMATAKHLVAISKYSTTKTRLTTIYYCTELKCYHLTMTSHSATIVSFGNNNPEMHCEFANLETRWRINIHEPDEIRDSNLTRLEILLNDVTAAVSPARSCMDPI